MEKKPGWSLFTVIFIVALILSFPFHYLKDYLFTKINQKSRGTIQVYSSDLGVGFTGINLERVYFLYQKFFFQVDSVSILPSITALLRGTLGISADVENLYGGDIDVVLGRGFKSIYVSVDTDDMRLEKIPFVVSTIAPISGKLKLSGKGKVNDINPPFDGTGSLSVKVPELKIPQKFKLNTGTGEFGLPAIPSLSPGVDGELALEGKTLRVKKLLIGKSGQALWGNITGQIQLDRNFNSSQLDLVVELTLGQEMKASESIQNIVNSAFVAPYMKTPDSATFRLRGTPAFPQMMPL